MRIILFTKSKQLELYYSVDDQIMHCKLFIITKWFKVLRSNI